MIRNIRKWIAVFALVLLAVPVAVYADGDVTAASEESAASVSQNAEDAEDAGKRLREELIYSVNRTPERTFETSRADKVITGDDIRRMNPAGLAQILEEQAGIVVSRRPSGGKPIIRGLAGKQVMVLIDGVKVNNASSGSDIVEYLNIVELSQIERIEIVRGVVSVLGTESLGGVINIITKGYSPLVKSFGGSISARYSSADSSLRTPFEVYGQTERFRFTAGISRGRFGDVTGGGDAGRQQTGFDETGGYFNGRLALTPEKSISIGYQQLEQNAIEWPGISGVVASRSLQLGRVTYHDLTARGWVDSLRLTVYWNQQDGGADITFPGLTPSDPPLHYTYFDGDRLGGAALELGTFVGSHHLVYGVDYAHDHIESWGYGPDPVTGVVGRTRGALMDRATYDSLGVYVQDRFDLTKWLTVIAGVRYGSFESAGREQTMFGEFELTGTKSDFTGAVNLVAHVTPTLNVIGNVFRGFRSPNLQDTSRFAFTASGGTFGLEVPNADADAEHVMSYEAGVKYQSGRFAGSAFVFRNELTNLLQLSRVGFFDFDENGQQDFFDFDVIQNVNVGKARTSGFELDARVDLDAGLTFWGHFAKTNATDTATNEPLSSIPGGFGAAGIRYAPRVSRHPWVELVVRHQETQRRLGVADRRNPAYVDGIPGYDLLHIRGGLLLSQRLAATVGVENLLDEQYRDLDALTFSPGRSLVIGTRYTF